MLTLFPFDVIHFSFYKIKNYYYAAFIIILSEKGPVKLIHRVKIAHLFSQFVSNQFLCRVEIFFINPLLKPTDKKVVILEGASHAKK